MPEGRTALAALAGDTFVAAATTDAWEVLGHKVAPLLGGGAVFFVVDNNHGTLTIRDSTLHHNPSGEFFTAGFPGIFFHSSGRPIVIASTIN